MSVWASIGGHRIVSGSVTIPMRGTYVADLSLAEPAEIAGATPLVIGDLKLLVTPLRSGAYVGAQHLRVVGGHGGWQKPLASRAYHNPGGIPMSTVLGDAAIECGERLAPYTERTIGEHYVREATYAQRVLAHFAPAWWVDGSGLTQISARRTGPITSAFDVTAYRPHEGRLTVATEVLADWMPGRSCTAPTLPIPQTISMSRFTFTNDGKARVEVLVR